MQLRHTVGIGALQSLNGPIQRGGGRGEGGARRSGGPEKTWWFKAC